MGNAAADVEVQVFGPDQDTLIELADQVEAVMRTVPGTTDVLNTGADRAPETRIVVDRRRAKDLNLSPGQIAGTLRTAINGTDVGTFDVNDATGEIDIVLRMNEATYATICPKCCNYR